MSRPANRPRGVAGAVLFDQREVRAGHDAPPISAARYPSILLDIFLNTRGKETRKPNLDLARNSSIRTWSPSRSAILCSYSSTTRRLRTTKR